MCIRQLSNVNSWHRIYSCMNCFVNQYISRRKKTMKKPVKSIIKSCYIINVVLANAYITSRRIDSAVMELEVWKINHAGPARSGLFGWYRYRSEKNLTGYNSVLHPAQSTRTIAQVIKRIETRIIESGANFT